MIDHSISTLTDENRDDELEMIHIRNYISKNRGSRKKISEEDGEIEQEVEKEKVEEELEKNGVVIVKIVFKRQHPAKGRKRKQSISKVLEFNNPGRMNILIHGRPIRKRKKTNFFSNSIHSKI